MAAPAPAKETEAATPDSLARKFAEARELDLVFAMDCTGSMGSYIQSAQASVRSMVEMITAAEKSDVRFGLVAYRDHPPQDSTYVTKVYDFTASIGEMRRNLAELSAAGGGDGPEALEDALHEVSKLDFRPNATKIAVLIADAPPHGLDGSCGDGFPNGCPLGLDPMAICRNLAEKGVTLYTIGCEPAITRYKDFFVAMAHLTGGQYCPLQNAAVLSSVIVGGAREEMSLERLMADVHGDVAALGREMSEEEQAGEIHRRLKEKKATAAQLKAGHSALAEASKEAVLIASSATMEDVRRNFKPAGPAVFSAASYHMARSGGPATASMMAPMASMYVPSAPAAMAPMMADMDMGGMAHMDMAAPPGDYSVGEDEAVSLAQCKRMVKKSRARHGWES